MKKISFIATIVVAYFMVMNASATIRTVSNNPLIPAQYADITSAITAAAAGDTILVAGSPTSYGDISISKKLILLGPGPNTNNTFKFRATTGTITFGASASNSIVKGFIIFGFVYVNAGANYVLIERNYILQPAIDRYIGITGTNSIIRGNVISSPISISASGINCVINNNIFTSGYTSVTGLNSTSIFSNNITFTSVSGSYANIQNNIFIRNNTTVNVAVETSCTFCNFQRNLTYNYPPDPMLPSGSILAIPSGTGSTGSNNLNNTDPLFVNPTKIKTGIYDYSDDCHLQVSSQGHNYGTDGTDLGVYGGNFSFQMLGETDIPQIYFMMLTNPVVPVNGTLNVDVKARTHN